MNVQEGPEWEIASHLLSDLRSVLHNQALQIDTVVEKFNTFDFSLLQHPQAVVRKAAVVFVMVLLKVILIRQESRTKAELLHPEQKGEHIVNLEQRRLFQLRHVRCLTIKGPIIIDADQTFVLHATNAPVKCTNKSQIKRFISDRQYLSYLLQRSDGSSIQLGLEKDKCETLLTNPTLLQTIPDPLSVQIFTTLSTFSEFHFACPIEFMEVRNLVTVVEDDHVRSVPVTDRPSQRQSVRLDPQWVEMTPGRNVRKLEPAESFESVENLQSPQAKVYRGTKAHTFTSLQEHVDLQIDSELIEREPRKSVNRSTKESLNRLETPGPRKSPNYLIRPVKVPTAITSPTLLSKSKSPVETKQTKSPKEEHEVIKTSHGLIMRTRSRSPITQPKRKSSFTLSPMREKLPQQNDTIASPSAAKVIILPSKSLEKSKQTLRKLEALQSQGTITTPKRKSQFVYSPSNPRDRLRSSFMESPNNMLQIPKDNDQTLPWNLRTVPTNKGFFVVRSSSKREVRDWLDTPKQKK